MSLVPCGLAAAISCVAISAASAATPLFGVNLSGLEMGSGIVANTDYAVPDPTTLDGQNMQVIRLPFTLERLQSAGQPLDPAYLGTITGIIAQNATANVMTVLDPHDYGYIATDGTSREIGVDPTGTAEYLDAVTRLATAVRGLPSVAFGLMNEPNQQTCAELAPVWQQAITAIRASGFTGPIMVPPTNWSHADTLVSSGCGDLFAALADPENNLVVEVHNYLDPNQSGTYTQPIASVSVGSQQLAAAIAWSEQTGIKLYVGETGTPSDPNSVAALRDELTTIKDAPSAFWGVTLWAAGPWWPASYVMNLNPVNGAQVPQMVALGQLTATPEALVLDMTEDEFRGNARYAVTLDGQRVVPSRAEPVTRDAGYDDAVTIPGPFDSGLHHVTVTFLNDAYAGTPTTDRNLYLDSATFNGLPLLGAPATMLWTGSSATVTFIAP